jgi:signal transduction histidine kinase
MLLEMWFNSGEETIPYHLLFLSFTITYGFRIWPMVPTIGLLALITGLTGWVMYVHFLDGAIDEPELAEVVLMPALVVSMVWHARRRAAALWEVELMSAERKEALERERNLFRDTAHAIRTPVTIARGTMELLASTSPRAEFQDDVAVVMRQLRRMSRLSDRLLFLAHTKDSPSITLEVVRVDALLQDIGHAWSASSDRRWVVTTPQPTLVRADADVLSLAIDALVENAVHFTGQGDRIELRVERTTVHCVISVIDSGPGLSPEAIDHAFDRFWHNQPPNGPMGSGLGLTMVQAIARIHGGAVRARNNTSGGARFDLVLPV